LNATDVMKVYLLGTAADSDNTADVIVDVNEEWENVDASGRVDLGAILGAAITGTAADVAATFSTLFNVHLSTLTATSIINLIAQFTGITSLANWLRGLARKDAMDVATKTELNTGGGGYDEATDSLEAQRDNYVAPATPGNVTDAVTALGTAHGAGSWATATGFATSGALATVDGIVDDILVDTGTTLPASIVDLHTDVAALSLSWSGAALAASVASGAVSQIRGDVWNIAFTGLAANTGYSAIDFSIKEKDGDSDDAALVHIRLSAPPVAADGLVRLNGADPGDLTAGSITVVSSTAITVHLDADKTATFAPMAGLIYDVQYLFTAITGPVTVEKGTFTIVADVTRATT
jgi:hypothetical protein